ncbi:aryl-sulfate sulfotransferase [Pseudodesulfovibrio sediminis]|uniref:Probable pectate lyase C n=1 Tax=Pseudodesulfovibrio sediminis TaxID=2810563 RepID=A0ABN6EVB1_9BACT|nr:aryl-sulfate sulfotransferase [Pseudodesulfovibrio sediminis]BCS89417.1 hypothetical protein PSDVSF_26590 [Pseudodesulfovibrio sediminis]
MNHKILLAALVLGLVFMAGHARAATLFVNGKAAQPGSGTSWATPFSDLNTALAAAAKGDQIWVAAGTYTPTADPNREATFQLREDVAVYGGFDGTETDLSKRNVKKNQTTLSGDLGVPGMPEDNAYHVVTGANGARIDGFSITGGYSQNTGWQGDSTLSVHTLTAAPQHGLGAGMLNFKSAPVVANCVFQDNHALMGGAVYSLTGATDTATPSPQFLNCTFWQNSALVGGGGVANQLSAPLFVSCEFDSNLAEATGGGMLNDFGSTPRLLNTIFRNNEAQNGGGMANQGTSAPTLYYSTFTGNRSTASGPAIFQGAGTNTTVLLKTVVWGNECDCADTRFANSDTSTIRVEDSTIQNGYDGKSVFQANPGLDRQSETMLNTGFKTNGHRFRPSKLDSRLKGIDRYAIAADMPVFDPSYTVTLAPAVIEKIQALNVPAPTPAPAMTAEPAPTPLAEPAPRAEVPPVAKPTPAAPKALTAGPATPAAKTAPATPAPEAAPAASAPAPKALAMTTPPPSATTDRPAKRPDGPPSTQTVLQELDLDGNGCITINEARGALTQQFWRVDNNGDGCLSERELSRFTKQHPKTNKSAAQRPPAPVGQPAPKATPKVRQVTPPPPTAAPVTQQAAAPALPKSAAAAPQGVSAPVGPSTGYTLFAPIGGTETYLVNMQGDVVKTWRGTDRSSGAVYLLNNGNLLRTVSPAPGEVRTPFVGEGVQGGIIQEISPRGQIVWEYSYVDNKVRQHHDIEPLPNGNVLILAWELKAQGQLAAVGASVRNHPDQKIWAEHIVEVRKSGPRSGYIVWEWHAWDHLVQNTDKSAPNFATPSRMPQRIDVNYNPRRIPDWQHANSIDYSPISNQIVVSLRNMNEIWVIDHSTTSEQAASSSGGIMHRGGDLLFRWGNPAAYGSSAPQVLFSQHDARWTKGRKPGDESITLFNNGNRRHKQSDVIEIKPAYYLRSTQLDAKVVWSYLEKGGEPFYAGDISGAQRLPNGNMLICEGTAGRLFEVDAQGKTVWTYQHEAGGNGPGDHIFRATRIPDVHPGVRRLIQ